MCVDYAWKRLLKVFIICKFVCKRVAFFREMGEKLIQPNNSEP